MCLRALARGDTGNRHCVEPDNGRIALPIGGTVRFLEEDGEIVDQKRILTHPDLPAVEGQGIYRYAFNPDVTRNFIYAASRKTDTVFLRTIGSNVAVQVPQKDEDVVITEVWLGGDRQLSTLAEMARVFDLFWNTPLSPGNLIGWEPLDVSVYRYLVRIVSVQIGGVDYEYKEIRPRWFESEGAYINSQLTLQMKLERPAVLPACSIYLEGA